MYRYNICTISDREIFNKQCRALEKHIPSIKKGELLNDVDGSVIQQYTVNDSNVTVHDSKYIDAVYVESEIELESFFKH